MRASQTAGRNLLGAVTVLATAAVVAGCGGSSKPAAPKASAQVSASSIVRAAYTSSAAAGYKVALTLNTTTSGQSLDVNATGSYVPAAHQATLTMAMNLPAADGGEQQFQLVLDGGTEYVKLPPALAGKIPGGKPWLSIDLSQVGKLAGIPGFGSVFSSSASFNDPTEYLDYLRATSGGTVQDLGQEAVNGIQTTHYHAVVQFAKLPDAVPSSERAAIRQLLAQLATKTKISAFPVDVWIDSSHLVRRLKENLTETLTTGKTVTVAINEDFLDYGTQPAPTVPSPDQTLNLLSLLGG